MNFSRSCWLAVTAVLLLCVCTRDTIAEETKATVVGVIEFQNTPLPGVVCYLSHLYKKPILVSERASGAITLSAKGPLTVPEAMRTVVGAIESNGYKLIEIGGSGYKLIPSLDASAGSEVRHVDLDIGVYLIRVGDASVALSNLTETLEPLVTPETEVRVYNAPSRVPISHAEFEKTHIQFDELRRAITDTKAKTIFWACSPR